MILLSLVWKDESDALANTNILSQNLSSQHRVMSDLNIVIMFMKNTSIFFSMLQVRVD